MFSVVKNLVSILFILLSPLAFGGTDSTSFGCSSNVTYSEVLSNKINSSDTLLVSSTLLDPQEDLYTPSFFAINSGLYKFPIILDTEDYGWISKNLMLSFDKFNFKNDTTPFLNAKYDHAFAYTHWFKADFDRMIGKSKLSAKLNRNFQNELYDNTNSTRENFAIGSEMPFSNNYTVTLGYLRNKASLAENGGFSNIDSLKEVTVFDNNSLYSNLKTATNNIFNQKAIINQEYKINFGHDSIYDSSSSLVFKLNTELIETRYSFELSEADIDSGYFINTFLDTTATFDSIGFKKIVFEPNIEFDHSSSLKLGLGVHKEFNDNSILNNSYAIANSRFSIAQQSFILKGRYHFENAWNGNHQITGSTFWAFKTQKNDTTIYHSSLNLSSTYKSSIPSYLFLNYFGNHFNWSKNFEAIQSIDVKSSLSLNKLNTYIDFDIKNISNYIYLDENSLPQQTNQNITAGKIHIKNQLGNERFKLHSGLGFQFSNSDLIRIPSFFSRNTFVWHFKLRKVPFNAGTTVSFFTKYKGLNYNPSIRHYHLSNQKVGGTPVVDWFLATRIGPADLYVKYDNSLYNFDRSLLLGEHYPIYKSYLRFGLKWRLKN